MRIDVSNTGMDYHAVSSTGKQASIVFGPDKPAEDTTMNPVELFVAALGMCIAAMLRKFCTEHSLDAGGITVALETDWEPGKPKCSFLNAKVRVEGDWDERRKAAFLKVAETCPVHMTIAECDRAQIEVL
ncbi:MAG: OsmC family protein [Armatimonadota bacterium]